MASKAGNDTKSNLFRHCDKPTIKPVTGIVTGKIPDWIQGTLIRNGPGIQKIGPDQFKHLFDGLAYLHRYRIENGKATYNSRPLESDTYKKNMAAERIIVDEFGTIGYGDPCDTLFNRFKSLFISDGKTPAEKDEAETDNCSVNVAFYGDQLYAMTETSFVRQVDPESLETMGGKTRLTDYVAVNGATAHPHILEDGTALNMGSNFRHAKGTHYCIVQVPPAYESSETSFKDAKIIAEIPCRWKLHPCYYHSFGMTTDKIIFIEQPYCISIPKLVTGRFFRHLSYKSTLHWYPNEKTRIYIVSRSSGEIHPVVYETEKLFTYHHCNAYEKDGQIILDVSAYDSADFTNKNIDKTTINKPSGDVLAGAGLRRYVLPLEIPKNAGTDNLVRLPGTKATAIFRTDNIVDLTPHTIIPEWFEFPRINYLHNGKEYNFAYGATASEERTALSAFPEPDTISKVDVKTGKITSWQSKGILASEPVFISNKTVANPAEDDGVILVALLHQDKLNATTLLILDAKNMAEVAKVEFKTEGAVTSTFHGQWAHDGDKVHLY